MKITAMGSWRPRPGTALHWAPAEATSAAATSAPGVVGAMTFLAENHVRGCHLAQSQGVAHRAYLGSGTDLDGDLDVPAVTRALETFLERHSILRSWFDVDEGTVARHVVAVDDIAFAVRSVGTLASTDDITRHLRDLFAAEANSITFPGFAFGAITRPGSFSLFFAADHALSDGASQALALSEIVGLYYRYCSGAAEPKRSTVAPCTRTPGDAATPAGGEFADFAAMEAELTNHHAAGSPEFAGWQNTFRRNGLRMPSFPLDLGLGPGETAPVRPVELPILDGPAVTAFDRVCKAAGGRVPDGVYAALAITDRELAGRTDYYGMTVFNTRSALDGFESSQGWFCSFGPVEFSVDGAATFTDLVATARAGHQRAKRLAGVPVGAALSAMVAAGASPSAVVTAPNLLSYIDFRWFPGAGEPAYDRGVIFTGEGRTANASLWINRDHDSLYLGSQTPDTPFAQLQVRRYFDHLCSVIQHVAESGDYAIGADSDHVHLTTIATPAS
ncbi:condensation domain-containing protein [Gordonia sinesedis]